MSYLVVQTHCRKVQVCGQRAPMSQTDDRRTAQDYYERGVVMFG